MLIVIGRQAWGRQGWVRPCVRVPRVEPSRLNLALQGGGAHGAFTWGALDRLLEERRLAFGAISGTSAGAINAGPLPSGLIEDGPAGALEKLARFWTGLCRQGGGDVGGLFETLPGLQRLQHAGMDLIGKFLAPAQFNPLDFNPMRDLLRTLVDFEQLRRGRPDLFIAATDAATGRKRIFTRLDISLDAVMASACLPQIHRAVEIDGRQYWDGGYVANPPLMPLINPAKAEDTLLIQLIPLAGQGAPADHAGISEGLNRIIFNAPLRQRSPPSRRWRAARWRLPAPSLPPDRRDAGDGRAAARQPAGAGLAHGIQASARWTASRGCVAFAGNRAAIGKQRDGGSGGGVS